MEKIFFVKNGELDEVKNELASGGKIKQIHPVAQNLSAYGYGEVEYLPKDGIHGCYTTDIFAYIVISYDD